MFIDGYTGVFILEGLLDGRVNIGRIFFPSLVRPPVPLTGICKFHERGRRKGKKTEKEEG
jgi:hypothetical protein